MPATEGGRKLAPAALILFGTLAAAWQSAALAAGDGDHAVVLVYHHVSDSTPASTSISPALFDAHLDYLDEHGYAVVSLEEIVAAFEQGRPLPDRSVGISFDDAYESILTAALPRLARRGWPFTVFVSTDAVDQGLGGYLDWNELRRLEAAGATIANHSRTHAHLVRRQPGESPAAWRQRVRDDIEYARDRLAAELERPARLLAWPYGEFDAALEALAAELGYVAFGQQSGPAGPGSGMQRLPRFPMASWFAAIDRLQERVASRPLPVTVVAPDRRILPVPARPPELTLRVGDGPFRLDALRCYVRGQDPARIRRQGDVITVRAQAALPAGRGKFNCTAPSTEETGVYYWYSHLWMQPRDDGSWYPE